MLSMLLHVYGGQQQHEAQASPHQYQGSYHKASCYLLFVSAYPINNKLFGGFWENSRFLKIFFFFNLSRKVCTFISILHKMLLLSSLQTHHVYFTLKRRGNGRFLVISTRNTPDVFVRLLFNDLVMVVNEGSIGCKCFKWRNIGGYLL